MASTISTFLVGLGLDTSNLDKGLRDTDQKMRTFGAGTATALAAIAATGVAAFKWTGDVAKKYDTMSQAADRVGSSVKQMAGYDFSLAQISGVDEFGAAEKHLRSIADLLGNVKRGTANFDDYATAGYDVRNWGGMTAQQVFNDQARQFQMQQDPNKRNTMAQAAGLSNAEVRLFSEHGAELSKLTAATAEQLNITDDLIVGSRQLNDRLGQISTTFEGLQNIVAAQLMPSMVTLAGGINDAGAAISSFLKNNPGLLKDIATDPAGKGASRVGNGIAGWVQSETGFDPRTIGHTVSEHTPNWVKSALAFNPIHAFQDARQVTPQQFDAQANDAWGSINQMQQNPPSMFSTKDYATPEFNAPVDVGTAIQNAGDKWLQSLREQPLNVNGTIYNTTSVQLDGRELGRTIDERFDLHVNNAGNQIPQSGY